MEKLLKKYTMVFTFDSNDFNCITAKEARDKGIFVDSKIPDYYWTRKNLSLVKISDEVIEEGKYSILYLGYKQSNQFGWRPKNEKIVFEY